MRRRKAWAHQARVGYFLDGPLCQCGRWNCPDLGRELDRRIGKSRGVPERVLNVGQVIVIILALSTLLVCCVGGALWVG